MDQILTKLKAIPGYVQAFDKATPGKASPRLTLAKAVAISERTMFPKTHLLTHDPW